MIDNIKCPRCGGRYHLKETCVYEINDDGSYDWAKPIYSECIMSCFKCDYVPCFENDIGLITICEDEEDD